MAIERPMSENRSKRDQQFEQKYVEWFVENEKSGIIE